MKLVIVHNIPAPYRVEFFNKLSAHPSVDDLHVIYLAARQNYRPWKQQQETAFSHEVLKDYPVQLGHQNFQYHFNPGIYTRLGRFGKDWTWINYSYIDPTCMVASVWRSIRRQPWILMTEAPTWLSRKSRRREMLRRLLLLPAVVGSRGMIVLGPQESLDYFRCLLPQKLRMFSTPYFLDIAQHLAYGEQRLREWRLDASTTLKFMYSGQLATYSNVETIIRAFVQVWRADRNCELHIVGNGAHRPVLEGMIPEDVRPYVIFRGPYDWKEMPVVYMGVDVLVHASLWQAWGMVVSEALASGVPVIASKATGAGSTLVEDGVNGFLFDSTDDRALAEHMLYFCANRGRMHDFAAQAVRAARRVTLDKGVQEFVEIVSQLGSGCAIQTRA